MTHAGHETFPVRQEEDRIPSGKLARTAIVCVLVGLAGVFTAWLMLKATTGSIRGRERDARSAGTSIANVEQSPILGAAEGLDLEADQRRELSRYRWLDRDAGVAAIPIDRAMDIFVERSR
jgi:hypothetical protein